MIIINFKSHYETKKKINIMKFSTNSEFKFISDEEKN